MISVREHVKQSGTKVTAHKRMPAGAMVGGEFIAPGISQIAKHFILMARALMYSDGMEDALQKAIHGGKYLADGTVPFLSQMIVALAHKVKAPLSDEDMHAVVVHLAGSLVDLADKLGDPSAKDKRVVVQDIVDGVMAVLSGKVQAMTEQAAQQDPSQGQQPPQQPGQAPLLASAANG